MKPYRLLVLMVVCMVVTFSPSVWSAEPDKAAQSYSEGQKLLQQGDFEAALKNIAEAAKADPENLKYRENYMILRKVIKMRDAFEKEENPQKWEAIARSLRSFYYMSEIYSESIKIDQKLDEKLKTTESATMLAESELALGKNAEAATRLASLDASKMSPQAMVMLAVAQARQNQMDQAKLQLGKLPPSEKPDSAMLLQVARVRSLMNEKETALSTLKMTFENTTPSRLEYVKRFVVHNKDFDSLRNESGYEEVLKVESKLKESDCTGGSSCGSCTISSCPSKKGATASGTPSEK